MPNKELDGQILKYHTLFQSRLKSFVESNNDYLILQDFFKIILNIHTCLLGNKGIHHTFHNDPNDPHFIMYKLNIPQIGKFRMVILEYFEWSISYPTKPANSFPRQVLVDYKTLNLDYLESVYIDPQEAIDKLESWALRYAI